MDDVTVLRWPQRAARARRPGPPSAGPGCCSSTSMRPRRSPRTRSRTGCAKPAADLDVRARIEGLRLRLEQTLELVPELDDDGVIRFGERWAPLPPVEARLTEALVGRFGAVVSRDDLAAAGLARGRAGSQRPRRPRAAPAATPRNPVRLAIRTVRSRGYLLEPSAVSGTWTRTSRTRARNIRDTQRCRRCHAERTACNGRCLPSVPGQIPSRHLESPSHPPRTPVPRLQGVST